MHEGAIIKGLRCQNAKVNSIIPEDESDVFGSDSKVYRYSVQGHLSSTGLRVFDNCVSEP